MKVIFLLFVGLAFFALVVVGSFFTGVAAERLKYKHSVAPFTYAHTNWFFVSSTATNKDATTRQESIEIEAIPEVNEQESPPQ
jgi:hypothetical protein